MRRYLAEFVGTFGLVLFGCGAIVVNSVSGGSITQVGIALAFGLVVMVMIEWLGDVSGAHINPAVSVAFWFAGRLPGRALRGYVAAQCLGALAASGLLRALFPRALTMGQTGPAGFGWDAVQRAFVLELLLTLILMAVILAVSSGNRVNGLRPSVSIGATVGLMALVFGPVTGASMNPARSLGPAVVAMDLSDLGIYLIACPVGALLAVPLHRALSGRQVAGPG